MLRDVPGDVIVFEIIKYLPLRDAAWFSAVAREYADLTLPVVEARIARRRAEVVSRAKAAMRPVIAGLAGGLYKTVARLERLRRTTVGAAPGVGNVEPTENQQTAAQTETRKRGLTLDVVPDGGTLDANGMTVILRLYGDDPLAAANYFVQMRWSRGKVRMEYVGSLSGSSLKQWIVEEIMASYAKNPVTFTVNPR